MLVSSDVYYKSWGAFAMVLGLLHDSKVTVRPRRTGLSQLRYRALKHS